jgi:hypothetical protein
MILDAKLIFAQDFDLTTITVGTNANLTNIIDLGVGKTAFDAALATHVMPNAWRPVVQMVCSTSCGSAGTPAVTVEVRTSASSDLSTPTVLFTSTTALVKTKVAGDVIFRFPIPMGDLLRYIGVNIAVATAAFSSGKVDAFISLDSVDGK